MYKGVMTALITPFKKDGTVDYARFKKQIDYQIENGIGALVFLGTTGESATLSHSEKIKIIRFAVRYVAKRAMVIVGTGGNNTQVVRDFSREAERLGADALLVVTPYYNKCTQGGLIAHYTYIADSVHIPIILYNVPGRTGVNILPETAKKLAQNPNIVGIKEASGNMGQILEMLSFTTVDFAVYSGDDVLTLPVLSAGGSGVVSVASNIVPKEMKDICDKCFDGDIEGARYKQNRLRPLIKSLFAEVNPIPIKCIMKIAQMDSGVLRLPLTDASSDTEKMLVANYNDVINQA